MHWFRTTVIKRTVDICPNEDTYVYDFFAFKFFGDISHVDKFILWNNRVSYSYLQLSRFKGIYNNIAFNYRK